MFQRLIEPVLKRTAISFPVTVLTGPRQSGKTTLLKGLFPTYRYINLESPDVLLRVREDPKGFFCEKNAFWIIDEAQNYPELFSYIQENVDQHQQPGRFILSGSQNFLLADHVSQSLAGRAAMLDLLPLTYQEYKTVTEKQSVSLWEYLYNGSFPRPYHEGLDIKLWYTSYIKTYIERDVRSLVNIKDFSKFQFFLKLCAASHGQLLNMNSIGQSCGISQTTVQHWLSILEASYLVYRLQPHYKNYKKRLVKTAKLYFYDSAIVCQLLGIESPEHLKIHTHRGAIFEGFVLSELIKMYFSKGGNAPLFFWRDATGIEIDGLIEKGERLEGLEIKATATFSQELIKPLLRWQKISGVSDNDLKLIYAGEETLSFKNI